MQYFKLINSIRQVFVMKSKYKDDKVIIVFITLCIILSRIIMYILFVFCYKTLNFNSFIQKINIWDAGWYQNIATNLYFDSANNPVTGEASWAFFPLFPVCVRYVWKITGIDIYYIASFLSTIFLGIAEFVGYKYIILTRKDVKQGLGYIYFLSFGTYSFYFSIFYTESLYLLLLTSAFYYLKKGEYLKMGVIGALLSMTRNTGVFFCFVILAFWLKEYLQAKERSIAGLINETIKNYKLLLGTMLVPLGLFSYMLYLFFKVGDAFAFVHVQRAWGRESLGILNVLKGALFGEFPLGYFGICVCMYIFLLVMLIFKHKHVEEAIFPTITLLVAANSSLGSTPRYMAGSFIMLLAFTDEWKGCSRLNKIVMCIGMFIFELIYIHAWINGSTVLI